jgi:hypothetical protein
MKGKHEMKIQNCIKEKRKTWNEKIQNGIQKTIQRCGAHPLKQAFFHVGKCAVMVGTIDSYQKTQWESCINGEAFLVCVWTTTIDLYISRHPLKAIMGSYLHHRYMSHIGQERWSVATTDTTSPSMKFREIPILVDDPAEGRSCFKALWIVTKHNTFWWQILNHFVLNPLYWELLLHSLYWVRMEVARVYVWKQQRINGFMQQVVEDQATYIVF